MNTAWYLRNVKGTWWATRLESEPLGVRSIRLPSEWTADRRTLAILRANDD